MAPTATFTATASRELQSAQVDGQSRSPAGAAISSPPVPIDGSRKLEFRWQDRFGLAGKEPFTLSITAREDEAPSLSCEDLPRQKVVLDTELLSFKVRAQDDFGIKRDRHRLAGHRESDRLGAGQGRAHPLGRRQRQGFAGDRRYVLGASRWASSPSR